MNRRFLVIAATLSLVPTLALAGDAPAEDAAVRGRQVLARAVDYAGGGERLRELRYFSLRLETVTRPSVQYVPASSAPARPDQSEISITADLLGKRFRREDQARMDGNWQRAGSLVRDGQRVTLIHARQEYVVEPGNAAASVAQSAPYLPPLLLKRAAANLDTVQWMGESRVLDQAADVIEFSWDAQTRIRLSIGRGVARVLQFEQATAQGEEPLRIIYRSERNAEGYMVPQQILQVRRGEVVMELALAEVTFSEPLVDHSFDLPAAYRQAERRQTAGRAGAN